MQTIRKDKLARHARLCDLIQQTIETDGQEAQGFVWAVRPRKDWADLLGVDVTTIADLIKLPPIMRMSTSVSDGSHYRRAVALRVALPGEVPPKPSDHETMAKLMAKAFYAETGRGVSRDAFGCLVGLAEAWPDGWQVQVFKYVVANWSSVMVAIKPQEAMQHDDPDYQGRFYRYVSIPVVRRFALVVADAFLSDWQTDGKGPLPFPYSTL